MKIFRKHKYLQMTAFIALGYIFLSLLSSLNTGFLRTSAQDHPASFCGRADVDNNRIFNYVDFDAFAKVYNNTCSPEIILINECGKKDFNSDNILNYMDFDSFAKRYYPYKANCDLEATMTPTVSVTATVTQTVSVTATPLPTQTVSLTPTVSATTVAF